MGDVLTIEGSEWTMTGFPGMGGRVETESGKIRLVTERVGEQTRAEAVKAAGQVDIEKTLNDLDEQLVFEVTNQDGKTLLVQTGKSKAFAELRFEKQP